MGKKNQTARITEVRNRKASHEYFVGESFEAGIVLSGTEVKSFRAGKAQINDAFVRIENLEAFMYQSHITEYDFGNINNHNPSRVRKLLLHKRELLKLKSATDSGGTSIIPLKMYLKNGLVKVLIAICTGKKLYDKRQDIKKKEAMREANRTLSNFRR
ncbi:MAG: SsrA-binding protein SmpB [Verrucomicrobiaceae bacterium]|jgi:SsrA-binding protein|nr:SsrA-binding protein SmpB [Verrucomicrobiaceae bacterium]